MATTTYLNGPKLQQLRTALKKNRFNRVSSKQQTKKTHEETDKRPLHDFKLDDKLVTLKVPQGFEVLKSQWVNEPYAFVSVLYNKETKKHLYEISEPKLTAFEKETLKMVHVWLRIALLGVDIKFEQIDKEAILYEMYREIVQMYGLQLSDTSFYKIWYYLNRNYNGFGVIDCLMRDPVIEDISCDGANVPIFLYHREYLNIEVDLCIQEEELNDMVMKLAQLSGKTISTGFPIVNAKLPDGSRLEATLGREVTSRGSSITIRKFREEPFTPADLIQYKTFSPEIMAYLWLAIENNKSMIFVGGTASGKTTTLNAVSTFIPTDSKIISIEDTRELQLYHENWIAGVTREVFVGETAASIDMFELLKSALRQRPEFLLVGEVRGKEAFTLFQAMSTGHTTYSTMHAGTVQEAVNRLLSDPINVPLMMLNSLDVMTIQVLTYSGRERVRRMSLLAEFVGIDAATGDISINELYRWDPEHDDFEQIGVSHVLEKISTARGWSKDELNMELDNRKKILEYIIKNNITRYADVADIVHEYSVDPTGLMSAINDEMGGQVSGQ